MAFAYEKAQKFLLFYRFHGRGLSAEDWRDVCFRIESCVFYIRLIVYEKGCVCPASGSD